MSGNATNQELGLELEQNFVEASLLESEVEVNEPRNVSRQSLRAAIKSYVAERLTVRPKSMLHDPHGVTVRQDFARPSVHDLASAL
jgi:hypothetical protein